MDPEYCLCSAVAAHIVLKDLPSFAWTIADPRPLAALNFAKVILDTVHAQYGQNRSSRRGPYK
jgi:hypothetical protein